MGKLPRGFNLASGKFAARDYASAGITIQVDAREFEKLGRALQRFSGKRQDRIMVAALNTGMDRLYTRVKRKLVDWSGIRDKARAYRDVKKRPASSGCWQSAVVVSGRHTRITLKNYGARWKRSWPGVKHRAWERNQVEIADKAFMRKGLAFRRVGASRMPIVPLFGPSMPREVERHEREARDLARQVVQQYVIPKAYKLMTVELAKAKRK